MATVTPIQQPTYSVLVTSGPIETGTIMGVSVSVSDLLHNQIAIIESNRGPQGFRGPSGSGFRYFSNANNLTEYIEASGTHDTILLQQSGIAQLGFDNSTNTLTIGVPPFESYLLIPLSAGGTNNNGNYDTNYLIYYDGNKLTSSSINALLLENFMSSGMNLRIGDGNNTTISYKASDRLNLIPSSGIDISFNDISNSITITATGSVSSPGLNGIVSQIIFG